MMDNKRETDSQPTASAKPEATEATGQAGTGKPESSQQPKSTGSAGGNQPPPKGESARAAPPPPPPPPSKGGKGLAAVALLIALLAIGGSGYVWYLVNETHQAHAGQAERVVQQSEQLDQHSEQLSQQSAQLDQQAEQLAQQSETLEQLDSRLTQTLAEIDPEDLAALKEFMTDVEAQQAELENLRQQLQGHAQQQERALTRLTDRIETLQVNQSNLADAQNDIRETLETVRTLAVHGGDVNALTLTEVEYLLRMANHKLQFQQDVEGARNALTLAGRRLAEVDEEIFEPVQEMIEADIAALDEVELPDIGGTAQRIAALEQQVDELPVPRIQLAERRERMRAAAQDEEAPEETGERWWERAGEAVTRQLRNIVVVRREGVDRPPLIAMEEEYFLRENLRLKLGSMRVALLQDDAASYQLSNDTARDWVQTYFDTDTEQVTQFLNELQELQDVQFDPAIPDVSATLQTFRDIMEQRQPVRSMVPAADETGT